MTDLVRLARTLALAASEWSRIEFDYEAELRRVPSDVGPWHVWPSTLTFETRVVDERGPRRITVTVTEERDR